MNPLSDQSESVTPYYDDGLVTLYHGDCAAILPTLEPVDLVVTSPPYNMGLVPGGNGRGMYRPGANGKAGRFRNGYGTHTDALPQDEYDAWQRDVLRLCWDRLVDDGAIFYNHRPRVEHGQIRLPLGFDFGFPVRQVITWDRGTGIDVNLRQLLHRGRVDHRARETRVPAGRSRRLRNGRRVATRYGDARRAPRAVPARTADEGDPRDGRSDRARPVRR